MDADTLERWLARILERNQHNWPIIEPERDADIVLWWRDYQMKHRSFAGRD